MIVFDVDGTLIDGESADWACFDAAFEEVAGVPFPPNFFSEIEEVTAKAIVHQALASLAGEERERKERLVRQGYLQRLRSVQANDALAFPAAAGAVDLIRDIKARGVPFAIATGDWRETIMFKLRAAGIATEGAPMVTSSDFYSRADIIANAVAQSGRPLTEAVYVGDGLWDLRACRKLGIPFIGVGRRAGALREAGAEHVLADLNPQGFWPVRNAVG